MVKPNPSEYLLFFLLSLGMLLAPYDAAAAGQSPAPRNVLLLTSYHQGDRWNDSVVQGVLEAMEALESVSLHIENLDMRRHTDQDHARMTTEYIRAKYKGEPQDLVLVSDDAALNFLLTVRDDVFPNTPVVFCGVNNFTPKRIQGQHNITGVNEALSLEATLELAQKLFPKTTRIMAVVSDADASGRANLEEYRAAAARMKGRVQFEELLNMTDKAAPDILSRLPKDSLVLSLSTLLKSEGGYVSIEDSDRIYSVYAPVPIFTLWSFALGNCALGGYVSSGQDQGRTAGNLAIRILEGQEADQIPVVMESPNVPMFDYKVMKRFGIKESALPKGSVVLNRRVSMWEQYWVWLLGIALFCGLQTFLILAFLASGKRLRAANFALRESEERYRSVVENISDVYYRTDVEGRLVMFSPSAMRLLGYGSLDEMLGRKAASFYADPVKREQLLERLRVEGSVNDYELTLRRRDGSELQVATSSSYYRDAAGAVLGVEGIFRDITERKRAEEELSASRAILKAVLDAIPVRVFWKDRDLKYLGCNAPFAWDAGLEKPEDLVGKDDYAMGWRDQAELYRADDRAVIDSGTPRLLIEEPQTTPSGGTIFLLTSKVPLRNDNGTNSGVLGTYIDITERKRVEEELKKLYLRQEALLAAIPDILMEVDANKVYRWANPAGYEFFGPDVIGRDASDFFEGEQDTDSIVQPLFNGNESVIYLESWQRRKDGEKRLLAWWCRVLKDEWGRSVGALSTARDITEQKWAEEEKEKLQAQFLQAQKMESVGRLAGGVAHDFNNMLGVILGYSAMALGEMPPESRVREYLQEVQKAAEHSAALTGQLLAFARKQTVAPKILDLNETVEGMLMMLRRLIGEDIDLAWLPGSNLDPVFIDPSQVDQILSNLCVNARDAISDTGKITIETGSVSFDEAYCADHAGFPPGEFVMLAVSDDGCGMAPETQANIFEPFFTTKELGKGTGLGLATVYGTVKQNSGFLNVYSEPGQGTTFKIYLPQHTATASPRPEQEQAPAAETGGENILLVEDEPAILKLTTMMLERTGYAVIAAGTPGEAIRLAREHQGRIDLLITDVVMPEMNGRDLARNLMSIYPDIRRLFMSGYTANVIAHHGVLDKGVHFIQKPFSMKELTAKVLEALARE
ncbi:MAG: ABC transporter substrate binding protein [Pseudomonadota bacterium]